MLAHHLPGTQELGEEEILPDISRLSQSTWVLDRRYSRRLTDRAGSDIEPILRNVVRGVVAMSQMKVEVMKRCSKDRERIQHSSAMQC